MATSNDDWADSDGEDLGDLVDLPTVQIVEPPPPPSPPAETKPPTPTPPAPAPNAWSANQSNDVRNLIRQPGSLNPPPINPPPRNAPPRNQPPRRYMPFNSAPNPNPPPIHRPQAAQSPTRLRRDPPPRRDHAASLPNDRPRAPGATRPLTLFVNSLPSNATEQDIAGLFTTRNVQVSDIRISRHSDTGSVRAAFVVVNQYQREEALAVNGAILGTRPVSVRIDDNNNRRHTYNNANASYSSFGSNKREENGWGAGGWTDRPSRSYDVADRKGVDSRYDRRQPHMARDPTIPTGPEPAGRKKLQLKPRTKPLPVIEVDRRAIDGPASRPNPTARPTADRDRFSNDNRRGGFANGGRGDARSPDRGGWVSNSSGRDNDRWSNARDGAPPRAAAGRFQNNTSAKKDGDSKRPVLVNAFSALQVNDSEASSP